MCVSMGVGFRNSGSAPAHGWPRGREGGRLRARLAGATGFSQSPPRGETGEATVDPRPALSLTLQRNHSRPPPLQRTCRAQRSWSLPATVALYSAAAVTRKSILLSNCGTAAAPPGSYGEAPRPRPVIPTLTPFQGRPGSGSWNLRRPSWGTCGGPGRAPSASGVSLSAGIAPAHLTPPRPGSRQTRPPSPGSSLRALPRGPVWSAGTQSWLL